MIKFLKSYTTKALPPEHFEEGQEVRRSEESELYFVQLGVAGYLVDGVLVDQDYKPIVVPTTVIEVVTSGDRRFNDSGRGGELLGLDAPRRASTGPGNEAVFGTSDVTTDLRQVEFDQLTSDLAASAKQFDEHCEATTSQIEQLQSERVAIAGELADARAHLETITGERDDARAQVETITGERDDARAQVETITGERDDARRATEEAETRTAELEARLAEAIERAEKAEAAAKPARAK